LFRFLSVSRPAHYPLCPRDDCIFYQFIPA
jgi:hypothetical protein